MPSPSVIEEHVTLTSPRAHEPSTSPERARADERILEGFWQHEEALGFPLTEQQKVQMRRLMALTGVVPTTGHRAIPLKRAS
jgi:hypothetical protein